jgi:hypothetical protein
MSSSVPETADQDEAGRLKPPAAHALASLWWLVLEFASHVDLTTASAVSLALQTDAQSDRLWLDLVRRRWALPRSNNTDPKVFGGAAWPQVSPQRGYLEHIHTQYQQI